MLFHSKFKKIKVSYALQVLRHSMVLTRAPRRVIFYVSCRLRVRTQILPLFLLFALIDTFAMGVIFAIFLLFSMPIIDFRLR